MTWMAKWAGGFPLYHAEAHGARIADLDGREYVDFCLGDTGAMAGHSPAPTVAAVQRRLGELGGRDRDAADRGRGVGRGRAARAVRRAALVVHADRDRREPLGDPDRAPADRPAEDARLLVLLPRLGRRDVRRRDADGAAPRAGNVGPPVDPTETTRVVEFNDLDALERELAHGDVAAVLAEPALTNIGIVLPEPGFHDALRELTRAPGRC